MSLTLACQRDSLGAFDERRAGFVAGRLSETSALRLFARLDWGEEERRSEATVRILEAGRQLDRRVTESGSIDALHEAGVFRLLLSRQDEAVRHLEEALQHGGGAEVRADLMAAYLARGHYEDRALDFVRAISLAQRHPEPLSPPLLINSALALRRLGLRREAARRLEASLRFETRSSWRHRLGDALEDLRAPNTDRLWTPLRDQLVKRTESGHDVEIHAVEAALRQFPLRARQLGEEALLSWARAQESGDVTLAAAWLELARVIGHRLATDRGETLLDEAAVKASEATDGSRRRRLVEAHLTFGSARDLFDGDDTQAALPLFRRSAELFAATESPFGLWAEFHEILCVYYSDATLALSRFELLAGKVDLERYPALSGRIFWLLGSASKTRQAHHDALHYYRRSFQLLERASGPAQSAFIRILIAETLHLIGDEDAAWQHRVAAMDEVFRYAPQKRVLAMLHEVSWALAEAGADQVALLVVEELKREAQELGIPFHLAAAFLYEGLTWARLGHAAQALRSLDRAEEITATMPQGPIRNGFLSRVTLARGLALRSENPRRALELLAEASQREESIGQQFYNVHLHLVSGEAQADLGEIEAARSHFLAAVDAYEDTRNRLDELDLRLSAAEAAQRALEAVLMLEAEEAAPTPDSFVFAERLRARELLDRADLWNREGSRQPTAQQVAAGLDPGVAVIHYTTLRDRILSWVLRRDAVRGSYLLIDRDQLRATVSRVRALFERDATAEELRAPLANLYEILLQPLEADLNHIHTLVFTPDRELSSVPFAALYDPSSQRYVIEDQATATIPSATLLYLHGLSPRRPALGRKLVVGVGKVARSRPGLEDLRAVEEEVRSVAAEYPDAQVLVEEEATPSRFLASLAGSEMIHFAGHALINQRRPDASILALHPGEAADDGGVRIHEALDHGLADAALVVLSACRTMDQDLEDRERPLGAAGILYAAGVPAILAGRLDLDDRIAARLTPGFHRALGRGLSPAEALHAGLLELFNEESISPSAWATFSIVGGIAAETYN